MEIISCVTDSYTTDMLFKKLGINLQNTLSQQTEQAIFNACEQAPVGNRNVTLTSIAGTLRRKGMGQATIEDALVAVNSSQFSPPLPIYEVQRIAASVSRYSPSTSSADVRKTLNDVGNAARLVGLFGQDLRYVSELKYWLIWDGSMWVPDSLHIKLQEFSEMVARAIYDEASLQTDTDVAKDVARHAGATHNLARLTSMQELASRNREVAISANDLDKHSTLLGVANGVIDLRTRKKRLYQREDLITQHSPVLYDPEAECPVFWRFMLRITDVFSHIKNPKERKKRQLELILYIRRIIGYCLTGKTYEQVMFFFYGSGGNGKSTLLNVIAWLLGTDMAKQTPPETLMASTRDGKPTNDLARLHRARVVTANEIEDGSFLSENLVKQLTGGDKISCRYLYAEFFEYTPQFKLIICGNHKPVIRGTDHGIWRRIQLVPFLVTIPANERDAHLGEKLRAELPGILNWALDGCRDWQRQGLKPPKIITDAVEEYREDMDLLGQWILDKCLIGPTETVSASDAYCNYRFWAQDNGLRPMSSTAFGRRLTERGFSRNRSGKGITYSGIGLTPSWPRGGVAGYHRP